MIAQLDMSNIHLLIKQNGSQQDKIFLCLAYMYPIERVHSYPLRCSHSCFGGRRFFFSSPLYFFIILILADQFFLFVLEPVHPILDSRVESFNYACLCVNVSAFYLTIIQP